MSMKIFKILISITLISLTLSTLKSANVELAINCGGEAYTTSNGIKFQKDNYFKGGQSSDAGTFSEIKNTKDQTVYQTERWSDQNLLYNIPVKNNGPYVLIFKFSEVYFNSIGEKVFDVKIGDEIIINDLDIYSKVGKNTAYDEFIPINIKNDNLYIDGKKIKNGYNVSDKTIKITFVKKTKDNPKINGILLVKGGLENTDYNEFKSRLDNFERNKIDREKSSRSFHRISKVPAYRVPAHPENRPGHATGILVGGNLCTFTPILGTQADATLGRDIILFIEEVEEDMSHIDRLINTLILNGVFDRCKGIVLGEFTGCKANLDFDSVEDMICSYVPEGIPVLCGFPTGHDDVNLPLVMGAPVTLDVTASGASLTFGMNGRQAPVRTEETVATPFQGGQKISEGKKQRRLVRIVDFLKHFEGIRH